MEETSTLGKVLIAISGIAVIVFSIMSTIIYIYTIYYYSVDNGFWGAVYGMCLPGFSSLTLFFDLIGLEGFFNNFTIMVLVWLCSGLIFAVPVFFNKNN